MRYCIYCIVLTYGILCVMVWYCTIYIVCLAAPPPPSMPPHVSTPCRGTPQPSSSSLKAFVTCVNQWVFIYLCIYCHDPTLIIILKNSLFVTCVNVPIFFYRRKGGLRRNTHKRRKKTPLTTGLSKQLNKEKDQGVSSSLSQWPWPRSMPERLWCQGPRGRGRGPRRKKWHANC